MVDNSVGVVAFGVGGEVEVEVEVGNEEKIVTFGKSEGGDCL
jgi:hypothetical protein